MDGNAPIGGFDASSAPRPGRLRFRSRVFIEDGLPAPARFGPAAVLVYDALLARRVPAFGEWSRRFPAGFAVRAGEKLKSLGGFCRLAARVLGAIATLPRPELTVVAAGGGSVCDAAGFLASTLNRGVALVLVPSTWLAAVDSAHGGKNALNAAGAKNQIGTFWPAREVHIVRRVLLPQPPERAVEALAEVAKIALVDGGAWTRKLRPGNPAGALVWATLQAAIEAKYRIVRRDPYETGGQRRVLNLGHTLGHAIEMHHGLPHGAAVALGLRFAIDWSERRGMLPRREAGRIRAWLSALGLEPARPRPISRAALGALIRRDKKVGGADRVSFVFLRAPGEPCVRAVPIASLLDEAARQGFASPAARRRAGRRR